MKAILLDDGCLMLKLGLYSDGALNAMDFALTNYTCTGFRTRICRRCTYRLEDGEIVLYIHPDRIKWPCGVDNSKCKENKKKSSHRRGSNCSHYLECLSKFYEDLLCSVIQGVLRSIDSGVISCLSQHKMLCLKRLEKFLLSSKAEEEFIGLPLDPFRMEGIRLIENELYTMKLEDFTDFNRWDDLVEEYDKLMGRDPL